MAGPWEKYSAAPAPEAKPAQVPAGPWAKYADTGATTPPEAPQGFLDKLAAIPGHIAEAITGNKRHTDETDALPDWGGMPELNSFSVASAKAGLGTLLANPGETVKIIQSNFPGVQVSQDAKGNYLMRSSIDGKQYAIKPGFQVSDIPRAAGGIAAFTPAGRATTIGGAALGAAATQAVIEGTQAATGGDFNPGDVAMAGLMGGAVPAVVMGARAAVAPAKQLLQRVRGINPAAAAEPLAAVDPVAAASAGAADAGAQAAAARPAAPVTAPAPAALMDAPELTQTARQAAEGGMGSRSATEALAEQAAPDAKVVKAAKRLGIDEYLQPDHVTTNQSYRELAQAVKSVPGSHARAAEITGLETVAKRADDLIEEIGGTHDISTLSANVKTRLQDIHEGLKTKADELYDKVRSSVPSKADAPADNVLAMISARADELGGVKNLSPMERMIAAKLTPKTIKQTETVPGNPLMPGSMTTTKRMTDAVKQPTYALLDDVRRDLTAARIQRAGPFKDSDTRLITMLEGALRKDQQSVAEKFGMGETWDLAQKTAATYKGVQDDLASIFGKNLDQSLVGTLDSSVKLLAKGDNSKLLQLLKSVPEGMRQEVVASGLGTAFGKSAKRGELSFPSYTHWYEGLVKNKQAYNALMANLPGPARKQLSDLYRVSSSISAATRERITTGRIQAIERNFKPAENFMARLYETAKRQTVPVAAGTIVGGATSAMAGPAVGSAVGAAITSALARGAKPAAIEAVDKLIASEAFIHLAKQGTATPTRAGVLRLVHSQPYKRFAKAVGQSNDPAAAEQWVRQALQANNNQH